jgi:anti-sigma B factor antagonist
MTQQVQVRADVLEDGLTVVWVTGDVDLAAEASVTQALSDVVASGTTTGVIVDLSGVPFLDSSGIRALVRGHLAAAEAGLDLTVRGAHGTVEQVLRLTGVDKTLGLGTASTEPVRRIDRSGQ